jgi:hypothetical protein
VVGYPLGGSKVDWWEDRSMPSQYPYRTTVRNEYLGVSKVIRAMTRHELHWLKKAQLSKWSEQETRRRQQRQKEAEREAARQNAENLKKQREAEREAARQNAESLKKQKEAEREAARQDAENLKRQKEAEREAVRQNAENLRRQKEAEREAVRQDTENLKSQAEEDTEAARQNLESFRSILFGSLHDNLVLDWGQLQDRRTFSGELLQDRSTFGGKLLQDRSTFGPFQFDHPKPNRDEIRRQLLGPEPREMIIPTPVFEKPRFLEFFLPFLRRQRLERQTRTAEAFEREMETAKADVAKRLREYQARECKVVETYNSAVRLYNQQLEEQRATYIRERNDFLAQQEAHNEKQQATYIRERDDFLAQQKVHNEEQRATYIRERDDFLAQQEAHNGAVLAFRSRYEAGSAEAVERYMQMVLERSSYPEPIAGEPDVRFDVPSRTLIVNFWLPGPAEIPNIVEQKYIAAQKAVKPVEMKQSEFEAFYDDVIHQIALRTLHEVFVADYALRAEAVVFNGWVRGIDRKTGKPFTSCILSYEASRTQFMDLDLAHVSPKECVRGLKGITAGPLIMLAPVKPIMELNRDDDRFVESKEVLDQLRPEDNLAAVEWEDFEHLVRELFEKEFAKTGGEVRVTQASRDRGVDAIAFDPDPIRGGKFVVHPTKAYLV